MDKDIVRKLKNAADLWERENPIIGVGSLRVCDALRDAAYAIEGINDRLAAYEETLKQYEALGTIDDLTALVKARDDGRVVVLDEPYKPLIWGDAEHNSLLCPCCKTDLVGLLYGNRIVLQCPECGQYVDGKTPVATYKAEAAMKGANDG